MTREQWLSNAVAALKPLFETAGATIPTVRVSVGFPGGGSARKRIGEYWHAKAIDDGIPQIFLSPVLKGPVEHLDTLVHELVHACTPGAGHKAPFKRLGEKVGLIGKPRSMGAGPELKERLNVISSQLGEFPHAGINLNDRKKQSTRLGKVQCLECGYTARVTRKWIEEQGTPLCPCNEKPMEVEQ